MAKAASSISLFAHSPRAVKGQTTHSPLDRSRPIFLAIIGALITLTILGAIFYIGLRVKVVNVGYKINQEIHTKEQIIEDNKRLNLEIARLKSPTRIESEAKEKFGLGLPAPHQIIYTRAKSSENLDLALAKIKPLPAEVIPIETPVSPKPAAAPEVAKKSAAPADVALPKTKQVARVEKKAEAPKPAPEEKKIPEVTKKPPPTKSPDILVAKIVREKTVVASNSKTLTVRKHSQVRESVPAVMLDSMP